MTPRKVTICIPAYDRPRTIKRLLDTIKFQDFDDFEVVVTDDSSDGRVEEVVRGYSKYFSIIYEKNKKKLGSPKNWNYALDLAGGEYIKLMHHDDWFESRSALGEFVKKLDNHPGADIAFCAVTYYDEQESRYSTPDYSGELNALKKNPFILLKGNVIGTPSTAIFRRTRQNFNDTYLWLVDVEFYIRLLCKNNNFVYMDAPLVNCTVNSKKQISFICQDNLKLIVSELFAIYNLYRDKSKTNKLAIKSLTDVLLEMGINERRGLQSIGIESTPREIISSLRRNKYWHSVKKTKGYSVFKKLRRNISGIEFLV
jgi:glycosyltransferase involved in cell wall biosynthesis